MLCKFEQLWLVSVRNENKECEDVDSYRQYTGKKQYYPWMVGQNFIQQAIYDPTDWLCETDEDGKQTYDFSNLTGRGLYLNIRKKPYIKVAGQSHHAESQNGYTIIYE